VGPGGIHPHGRYSGTTSKPGQDAYQGADP
jgi:hypothetical protein